MEAGIGIEPMNKGLQRWSSNDLILSYQRSGADFVFMDSEIESLTLLPSVVFVHHARRAFDYQLPTLLQTLVGAFNLHSKLRESA